jgi:hypothetical protein
MIFSFFLPAQWINPDRSKPETIIGYDVRENQFIITGDIDAWESGHPDEFASPVVSLPQSCRLIHCSSLLHRTSSSPPEQVIDSYGLSDNPLNQKDISLMYSAIVNFGLPMCSSVVTLTL